MNAQLLRAGAEAAPELTEKSLHAGVDVGAVERVEAGLEVLLESVERILARDRRAGVALRELP